MTSQEIKQTLVEKEKDAWMRGDHAMATFLDEVLQYIKRLERQRPEQQPLPRSPRGVAQR